MRKPLNVYISGPMSGLPLDNFPAFNRMEGLLDAIGANPLNPAKMPKGLSYRVYMQLDLVLVAASDVIISLPGHENSKGGRAEKYYGESIQIPSIEWHPDWGIDGLEQAILKAVERKDLAA